MPTLEQKISKSSENPPLLRELFYGSPKTRKTWLAGTAAEAGFNTILIDSDHGYHILLKQLSPEARKRLMIIEARDSTKSPVAAAFLIRLLKHNVVLFNEKQREIITNVKLLQEDSFRKDCIQLNIQKHLNSNTVLIIDSYTALVRSMQLSFCNDTKLDMTAAFDYKKPGVRDGFGWTGGLATWILEKISQLPCHIIVIAHKSIYEKYSKDQKTIEWSRIQCKSTSGPHAMTIGDKFSDILYFENVSSSLTKISTRADKDMEGGSRLIPPNSYNWEKLQFKDICNYAGIKLPSKDLEYLDFSIPKQLEGGLPSAKVKPKINTKPGLMKIKGLT